jgi:hypothetical protein
MGVCTKLPNGKSVGVDELTYEHLRYGGDSLYLVLELFSKKMRELEDVPENWLIGNITSIFKGGKKDKRNKANYRGITLLNIIGNVFERLMLNRWMPTFEMLGIPNAFQFAYQNDKSSLLASFVLQEMINHNVERGSKIYCCFLDSTKAFDTVWLDGLFFKLYNVGMKGKSWRILRRWCGNIKCCVSLNGKKSAYFPVKQGVRHIDILYTLDSASNYSVIADSGYSHEMRILVCFLFLKQGT